MKNLFRSPYGSVYLLFFLSGASALIYEIAWLNRIQLIMGYTIYALSTVLGSYLSGLAVGALAAHRLSSSKKCLNLYLAFELAIGVYGLLFSGILALVSRLYAPIVTDTNIPLPLLSLVQFFFCGLVIFFPTFLMGATLPLLAKHLYETSEELAENISSLYGFNTLGALAGCLFAGYFLLPTFGYSKTMYFAAAINIFLFTLSLIQFPFESFSWKDLFPYENTPKASVSVSRSLRHPLVWLVFLSGALSLFAQLLWNRLAALSFGPSVFVFPLITSMILMGIFLGSVLSSRFSGSEERTWRFLGINTLLAIPLVIIGNYFFGRFPLVVLWLNSTSQLGHGAYTLFQFAICGIAILPASTAIGAIFPAALSLYSREKNHEASLSVGIAYGMNIGGVLTGAILGGFVILPHFGLDILSRALAVSLVLALFLIFQKSRASYLHAVPLGILAMIIVLASPSFEKTLLTSGYFYNRIHTGDVKDYHSYYDSLQSFHDMYRYALVDYKDDAHGTVSIHEYVNNPEERWFRIDGKTDGNRRGDVATVRLLDYFPQIFAGNFENILTIGLGTGESASLTHEIQGMKTSKVIELSPSMIEFSRKHFPENSFHVWSDPRIKVVNRDGREYLLHTKEKFDLIMSEPSNPWVNGVASLFTLEFFRSIASHLKPGGIASVWFHSYGLSCDAFESVMLAAYHAFPNLIVFKRSGDFYFIASNDHPLELKPLPPERRHLEAKILGMLDDKPLSGDVTEAYATALSNAVWVRNRKQLERFARYGKFNTDDNQFLQYSGGRTFRRGISCFMSYF